MAKQQRQRQAKQRHHQARRGNGQRRRSGVAAAYQWQSGVWRSA